MATHQTFPPIGELAYEYVEHLRLTEASATRSQRFVEALDFQVGKLGTDPSPNMISVKVRGAMERLLLTKTHHRRSAEMLQQLETVVIDGNHQLTIILNEFILFLSAHASDALVQVDAYQKVLEVEAGYFEARAHKSRGGRIAKKRRLEPPTLVRQAVSHRPWVDSCLEVRAQEGWNAASDEALMQTFTARHTRTTHQCDTAECQAARLADEGQDQQARGGDSVITQLQSNSAIMDGTAL